MIQLSKEYLNSEKNISNVIEKAKIVLRKRKRLYDRYTKKVSNYEVKIPLEFYIINIVSGYFGGKAPDYVIKQETDDKKISIIKKLFNKIIKNDTSKDEFQIMIDYIKNYNDDSSFYYELVKDYFTTGACYGLQYTTNENEIVYSHVSSRQCVAIYDYSVPVQKIGLLRIWQELDEKGFSVDIVELITKDKKYYYKNSKLQPKEYKLDEDMTEDVKWKLVPALAIENPDELGFFEPALSLIDTYEQVIENNRNIFQYNDDAKLKITGYAPQMEPQIEDPDNPGKYIDNPEYKKEIERIRKMSIFFTPDGEGDISWIIKEINDTASENHKKTLMELILMTICVPNVTDVGFTNADNASALEKKFFPLEQSIIQADKAFKKELLAMWENIVDQVNTINGTNFDFRDIQINLKRNMPTENSEMVDIALKLRELLSEETCIGLLPYDLDVNSELKKKQQETEDNMANFMGNLNNNKNKSDNVESKEQESTEENELETEE